MYSVSDTPKGGLPHSDIHGSTPARGSPWLFAACHVLHRLLVPRHPPNALLTLEIAGPCLATGSNPPCTETIHTLALANPIHVLRPAAFERSASRTRFTPSSLRLRAIVFTHADRTTHGSFELSIHTRHPPASLPADHRNVSERIRHRSLGSQFPKEPLTGQTRDRRRAQRRTRT
jgi:hypothetical protein